MAVTAPETAARARLIAILEAEFAPEEVEIRSDKLNESLAIDKPLGGVYPGVSTENPRVGVVLDTTVYVQLFRQWDNAIDATQTVDPADIEEWAERLRRACQADLANPGDQHMWYFRIQRIDFPDDPSGNKSRLLATVNVNAENSGLVETTG
jgi:hypothetical protein